LQKRIWHIQTAVIISAKYVPHLWHVRSVTYTVRHSCKVAYDIISRRLKKVKRDVSAKQ
jgi:hypothetical protein